MVTLGIDIGGTSVKSAVLRAGVIQTGRSAEFARPSRQTLVEAIRASLPTLDGPVHAVGMCVPGRLDESESRVLHSINIPALQDLPLAELLRMALGAGIPKVRMASDAHAAAFGYWSDSPFPGRLLAIAIGTGVGACVLDNGALLRSTGGGCGHFGQIEVALNDQAPIGADGSKGSLEAYLGVQGLTSELGPGFADRLSSLDSLSVPIRALARAIRIGHAIYRPDVVALLGFTGMRLAPCAGVLRASIQENLTSVAQEKWTLAFAGSPFLAAIGVARLACQPPSKSG